MTEERKADLRGPADAAHHDTWRTTEHLLNGRVTDAGARQGLRKALDEADRATPRPKGTIPTMPASKSIVP